MAPGVFRTLVASFAVAYSDFRVIYTWRTWVFAWLLRVLTQVTLFTLVGQLIGSPQVEKFLFVGNALFIGVVSTLPVVASTSWERQQGTLPLLVGSPASTVVVLIGRSVQWIVDGFAVSMIALFVLGPLLGISLAYPSLLWAPLIVLLTLLSTYCFGLALAALVLQAVRARSLVSNGAGLVIMICCGVQSSVTYWPSWVQGVSIFLPVRHGLTALRQAADGLPISWEEVALEAAVGLGWLAIACVLFTLFVERGRRSGSLDASIS